MANQVYTLTQLTTAVTHVLAGTPNANLPPTQIINRAINWVTMQRPWIWRQKPFGLSISSTAIQAMVRGGDGMTVTVTSNGHGLIAGLQVQITGSTTTIVGDVPFNGSFLVATVIDANNFTVSNKGTAGDTAATPGFWIGGQMPLPLDFAAMMVLKSAPNSFRDVQATTLDDLVTRRQFAYGSTYELYYAISYLPQATPGSEPVPLIYMFPTPTQATINFLQGVYLRRVPPLVNPTDIPDVPSQFGDLIYHAVRAFAKSNEEDQAGEDWRITMMMLTQLGEEDGMSNSQIGVMKSTLFPRTFPVSQFYPNGRITA